MPENGEKAHPPAPAVPLRPLVTVIGPKSWLALLGITCLLVVALYWTLFGELTTKVTSPGILMSSGGVAGIQNPVAGPITDISVTVSTVVHKGDVVARIARPDLLDHLLTVNRQLVQARAAHEAKAIADLTGQLEQLRADYVTGTRVLSPYDGRVLEVQVKKGQYVSAGTNLFNLELQGEDLLALEAKLYVPVEKGKLIRPGQEVELTPSTAKAEKDGVLLGHVVSVSAYPVTSNAMMQEIGHQDLVQRLGGQSAPVEVVVALTPDKTTVSGYKWSLKGPDFPLNSGTICTGSIRLGNLHPISLLFP